MTESFNIADRVDAPVSAQAQKVEPVMSNNDIRDARSWIDFNANKQAVAGLPDVWAPEEKLPLVGPNDPAIDTQLKPLGSDRVINQPELNRKAISGNDEDVWAKFDNLENIKVNGAKQVEFGSKEWAEQARLNRNAFEKMNGVLPDDRRDDRGFPPARPGSLEQEEHAKDQAKLEEQRTQDQIDSFKKSRNESLENLERRADDPRRNLTRDERELLKRIQKAIVMNDPDSIESVMDDHHKNPESLKRVVNALKEDLAPMKIGVGFFISKHGGAELVLDPGGTEDKMVSFRSSDPDVVRKFEPMIYGGDMAEQGRLRIGCPQDYEPTPRKTLQHLSAAIISRESGLPPDEVIRRDNLARENDSRLKLKAIEDFRKNVEGARIEPRPFLEIPEMVPRPVIIR